MRKMLSATAYAVALLGVRDVHDQLPDRYGPVQQLHHHRVYPGPDAGAAIHRRLRQLRGGGQPPPLSQMAAGLTASAIHRVCARSVS
jgi:hypothetical protein